MQIDLNNATEFTIDNVAKLIASKDDSEDRQLRVTKQGIAYLSDTVAAVEKEDLATRFETWDAGNSYSGEAAAKDLDHVTRTYNALKKNWPKPTSTSIDMY